MDALAGVSISMLSCVRIISISLGVVIMKISLIKAGFVDIAGDDWLEMDFRIASRALVPRLSGVDITRMKNI